MSRFGNTEYNANGGASNSQDYKDRDSVLVGRYAIIEATLNDFGIYEGQYGQNIIPGFDDAEVLEGVICSRTDNGDGVADEKTKIFGWDKWYDRDEEMELVPFDEGGEITTDELGRRVTDEAGGDTYKYQIEEGVLEGRDEPTEIGDVEMWMSNGKKARTLAKVFSADGHDIIDDKDDDRNWLNADDRADFNLREELDGRRVMIWFEQVTLSPDDIDDLDQEVTYTDAVVLDAQTETPITIINDEEDDESGVDSDSSDDEDDDSAGGSGAAESDDSDEQELPQDVDELVDMFARTGQDNRDNVETIIMDEAPDGYEPNMDYIMDEISQRAA